MTTIHEYRPVGEAAEPKSVVKTLARIIGATVVLGAGAAANVTFLATPLPAHPTVVVGPASKPSAVVASAVAARGPRSTVTIWA